MSKIKESLEDEIKIAESQMKSARNDLARVKDAVRNKVKLDNFDAETIEAYAKNMRHYQAAIESAAQKINTYEYFLNLIKCEEKGLL
jgi:predicted  nucleic acid-binding Zn-ribbon protein